MVQAPPRAVDSAIVYEAVNLVNGHRYIGFTAQGLPRREWQHRAATRQKRHCHKFHQAIIEFGQENFVFRVMADFEGDEDLGKIYEEEAIAKYKPEYNLRGGGTTGGSISEETKRKLSAVQKGRPSPLRGVPISAAHRAAISAGKRKNPYKYSPEIRAKITATIRARRPTDKELAARSRENLNMRAARKEPVFCVTDGKAFESCRDADRFYGFSTGTVSGVASGARKTAGDEKVFCYVRDLFL